MIVEGYSVDLYCDFEGCRGEHGAPSFWPTGQPTKTATWKSIRAAGWKRDGDKIFCPLHFRKPEPKGDTQPPEVKS